MSVAHLFKPRDRKTAQLVRNMRIADITRRFPRLSSMIPWNAYSDGHVASLHFFYCHSFIHRRDGKIYIHGIGWEPRDLERLFRVG